MQTTTHGVLNSPLKIRFCKNHTEVIQLTQQTQPFDLNGGGNSVLSAKMLPMQLQVKSAVWISTSIQVNWQHLLCGVNFLYVSHCDWMLRNAVNGLIQAF